MDLGHYAVRPDPHTFRSVSVASLTVPISARHLTGDDLEALLLGVRDLDVTYPEIGATHTSVLPPGYHHDRFSVALGRGDAVFERGREAVQTWRAHRDVGASLVPEMPEIAVGTDVIVVLRIGPASVVAPCRLVLVTDTDDAYGFGYGTLPGHPERGEEAFHVVRADNGEVTFDVVAFSRPADPLGRLASPITRLLQTRITRGYLEGVRSYVQAT